MIDIRPLTPEDNLDDLIALSRAFFAEYEAHHEAFFDIDGLEDGHIVTYFTRSLDADDSATFIALHKDRIVGSITVHVRPQAEFYQIKRVGAISGLMVHQAHRRQGIATRLLAEARAFFRERGVTYFTVYTAAANRGALQFYERIGMAPLHVTMLGQVD
jgi:GNAT superfamily N-acetyltransferase